MANQTVITASIKNSSPAMLKRETLATYKHVALDGQLAERYQKAMREVEI